MFPEKCTFKTHFKYTITFFTFIIPDWLQNLFQVIKAVDFDAGTIK
jgi:hypothetical protein